MGANRELWNDYRETWMTFSRRLDQLQELVESGDRAAAASAFIEVEKSRLRHNSVRDRLAEYLGG
ncbi:MAG: hypothetical protein ABUS49_03145, partial [Acidobacteriota bacterium]